jgi:hypothetical protein
MVPYKNPNGVVDGSINNVTGINAILKDWTSDFSKLPSDLQHRIGLLNENLNYLLSGLACVSPPRK